MDPHRSVMIDGDHFKEKINTNNRTEADGIETGTKNMKHSEETLKQMTKKIAKAIRAYHKAIAENLQEAGEPLQVAGDDAEDGGMCVMVEFDGSLHPWTVDKIKWDEKHQEVMVHCISMDYSDSDYWCCLTDLGDATDYVLEAIMWK